MTCSGYWRYSSFCGYDHQLALSSQQLPQSAAYCSSSKVSSESTLRSWPTSWMETFLSNMFVETYLHSHGCCQSRHPPGCSNPQEPKQLHHSYLPQTPWSCAMSCTPVASFLPYLPPFSFSANQTDEFTFARKSVPDS